MPEQRYDASRQTIGVLLSTTSPRIEVPEWQRSYSWETAEVETFWQDLLDFERHNPGQAVAGEEYFLGSIVLVTADLQISSSMGSSGWPPPQFYFRFCETLFGNTRVMPPNGSRAAISHRLIS